MENIYDAETGKDGLTWNSIYFLMVVAFAIGVVLGYLL